MPDIEWQITDPDDPETIVKTPQREPPRWRILAVMAMIVLGVGLGLIYRSIPEPPTPTPRPTSIFPPTVTPQPTATSEPNVVETIDREAQALAQGDLRTFMSLQDPDDSSWQYLQSSTTMFNAWGVPDTGATYTIVASGTLPYHRIWADVIQYRNGRRFRETRFYRLRDNQWVHTGPTTDEDFWGSWRTMAVGHFSVTFRARDARLIPLIALRLEEAYQRVCRDLQCANPLNPELVKTGEYRVVLTGGIWTNNQEADLILPSPRISGLYLPDASTDLTDQTDLFNQKVYRFLALDLTIRIVNRQPQTSPHPSSGTLWADTISNWELAHLGIFSERTLDWVYLHTLDLPSLEALWQPDSTTDMTFVRDEMSAFVKFIAETYAYGPAQVANLLREVNVTPTLPEAIKHLGLSYSELKQKWDVWIKQLVESQS